MKMKRNDPYWSTRLCTYCQEEEDARREAALEKARRIMRANAQAIRYDCIANEGYFYGDDNVLTRSRGQGRY